MNEKKLVELMRKIEAMPGCAKKPIFKKLYRTCSECIALLHQVPDSAAVLQLMDEAKDLYDEMMENEELEYLMADMESGSIDEENREILGEL